MKMSEAFSLPVKAVCERDYCDEYFSNVYDKHGDILLPWVSDDVDCEAIVAAINNHDDLVESLESLLRMTENEPLNDIDEQLRYNAFKALRKAKGES